ncbi:12685_t:CDS:1, partial [Acaulospora colombiana]
MASGPVTRGIGPNPGRRRNNIPTRLDIPSSSLTPSSSAPSSLSPLIVPIPTSSSSSNSSQKQKLTNELISVVGRTTPQPYDEEDCNFLGEEFPPIRENFAKINPEDLEELGKLGEGAG